MIKPYSVIYTSSCSIWSNFAHAVGELEPVHPFGSHIFRVKERASWSVKGIYVSWSKTKPV